MKKEKQAVSLTFPQNNPFSVRDLLGENPEIKQSLTIARFRELLGTKFAKVGLVPNHKKRKGRPAHLYSPINK